MPQKITWKIKLKVLACKNDSKDFSLYLEMDFVFTVSALIDFLVFFFLLVRSQLKLLEQSTNWANGKYPVWGSNAEQSEIKPWSF